MSTKDTNPKDAVGIRKWRQYSTVPNSVLWALGVAMLEGARKYGRHNYRVSKVRASVYYDAAKGHLDCWWEGEDIDADSKLNHVAKSMASLAVLYDAISNDYLVDDRPPPIDVRKHADELQAVVDDMFERHPEAKPAFVRGDEKGNKS